MRVLHIRNLIMVAALSGAVLGSGCWPNNTQSNGPILSETEVKIKEPPAPPAVVKEELGVCRSFVAGLPSKPVRLFDEMLSQAFAFDSNEHALIGDEMIKQGFVDRATALKTIDLAAAAKELYGNNARVVSSQSKLITIGDAIALAGDYFECPDQLLESTCTGSNPATGNAPSWDEIAYARDYNVRRMVGVQFPTEAVSSVTKRFYSLAKQNESHFRNSGFGPITSLQFYRKYHEMALRTAYKNGRANNQDMNLAKLYEGFAGHYLTDMFAAGHMRTNRQDITSYWNKKFPIFAENFKRYLAERVAIEKAGGTGMLADIAYGSGLTKYGFSAEYMPPFDYKPGVWGTITAITDALPTTVAFGEFLSVAFHDFDNYYGVAAEYEGHYRVFTGDNSVLRDDFGAQIEPAGWITEASAVRVSIESMKQLLAAFDAGKAGTKTENDFIAGLSDPNRNLNRKFASVEALIPVPYGALKAVTPEFHWQYENVTQLMQDRWIRSAINLVARNRARELSQLAEGMSDAGNREALCKGIVKPLIEDGAGFVDNIIHYVPAKATGGGLWGISQDQRIEYYIQDPNVASARASITPQAKGGMINAFLDGVLTGGEQGEIVDILKYNMDDLVATVDLARSNGNTGWKALYGRLFSEVFADAGPIWRLKDLAMAYWGKKTEAQRAEIISWLLDGTITTKVAKATAMEVLKSMPEDERVRLAVQRHNEHKDSFYSLLHDFSIELVTMGVPTDNRMPASSP